MDPLTGTALISLGSTILGGLFGQGNKPKQPSAGPVYDIDLIETHKDNTAVYLIIGLVVLLVLIALMIILARKL